MALHLLSTLRGIVAVAVHLLSTLRVVAVAHSRLLPIVDAIATLLIVALLREATLLLLLLLLQAIAHLLAVAALRAGMHRARLLVACEVRGLVLLVGGLVIVRCGGHDWVGG